MAGRRWLAYIACIVWHAGVLLQHADMVDRAGWLAATYMARAVCDEQCGLSDILSRRCLTSSLSATQSSWQQGASRNSQNRVRRVCARAPR